MQVIIIRVTHNRRDKIIHKSQQQKQKIYSNYKITKLLQKPQRIF